MNITSGPLIQPTKLLLYGVEGLGKTTLISRLAELGMHPLFIDTEQGTLKVNLKRIQIKTQAEFEALIKWFISEKHELDTFVLDTVTGLEPIIETTILERTKKKRMGDFEYGRGSILLREEFDRLLFLGLDEIIKAGFDVVMIGHYQIQRMQLPEFLEGFDRYELAMDKRVSATLRQWCDHVLFANWDFAVVENQRDESRGVQGKGRLLYTTHAAAYDAKNRAGLPEKLEWDIKRLADLFNLQKPAEQPAENNGQKEHHDAWVKLMVTIDAVQWKPEVLTAFFQSRFPAFKSMDTDWAVVPLEYIRAATEKSEAFKTMINEFIASPPAKEEPAQSV